MLRFLVGGGLPLMLLVLLRVFFERPSLTGLRPLLGGERLKSHTTTELTISMLAFTTSSTSISQEDSMKGVKNLIAMCSHNNAN